MNSIAHNLRMANAGSSSGIASLVLLRKLLLNNWASPNLLGILLWPLSLLYWLVVVIRRWLYKQGVLDSYRAPIPVIVAGNLTVGTDPAYFEDRYSGGHAIRHGRVCLYLFYLHGG